MTDPPGRLLVAIAMSLVAGGMTSLHDAVALHQGFAAGGLLATAFLYEALFRNPPVSPTDPSVVLSVLLWHLVLAWLVFLGFF